MRSIKEHHGAQALGNLPGITTLENEDDGGYTEDNPKACEVCIDVHVDGVTAKGLVCYSTVPGSPAKTTHVDEAFAHRLISLEFGTDN